MSDLQKDIEDFKKHLEGKYGSIEIEGGIFKASDILAVFDMKRFDKAFNHYLKEKDEKRSIWNEK